jgi:transmembrane sensor
VNSARRADAESEYLVLQEAAEWFAVLRADDAALADQLEWQRWHDASPSHRAAWRRVEAVSAEFQLLPGEPARIALDEVGARGRDERRTAIKGVMLLCLTAGLGGAVFGRRDTRNWLAGLNAQQGTRVGDIRQMVLADAGVLWLNTDTRLDIDYTPALRRIALYSGEILITTAKDSQMPPRPLVVDVVHGRLRALGTRFTVRTSADATLLSVYEGKVQVEPREGGGTRIVAAGSQLSFDAGSIGQPYAADDNATAWTEHRLMPDQMRLDDFLAELSRYRRGYLGCAPEVAHLRLVGSYPLADTDRILAALAATLPVRVRRLHDWWVTVEAAPLEK